MNNPFDLKNYQRQVDFSPLEKARRNAYQASRAVNEARKKGIEPSKSYAERLNSHQATIPVAMVVEMAEMPIRTRSMRRKLRGTK